MVGFRSVIIEKGVLGSRVNEELCGMPESLQLALELSGYLRPGPIIVLGIVPWNAATEFSKFGESSGHGAP